MNYKIGDTVIMKNGMEIAYADKYIFLGTSDSKSAKPVVITKQVMGEDVEIGIFVRKPVEIVYNSDDGVYVTELSFYNVELFEKAE